MATQPTTTRRALLKAAPVIAAGIAIPVSALPHSADRTIKDALARWQAAHRERSALPDGKDIDEREQPFWDIIDGAEEVIRSTKATSPGGIAAKLWVALEHDMALAMDSRIAREADISAFADDSGQDWTIRLILSALRSLKAMEA